MLGTIFNAANQPVQTQFQYSYGFYGSGNAAFWEDRGYNNLNQLTSVSNFNDSPTAIDGALRVTYNYPATANNGQIASLTDNALGQTVSYTYDALKRLTAASASGGTAWNQSYSYDGFGNLTSKSGSGATFTNSVDQTTNRLAFGNFCYDPNGNVVSDQNGGGCGNPNYGYDVANRMVSAAVSGGTERYYYTADNKRVSTISSAGVQTIFIYGAAGEKLAVVFGGGGSIFTGQITNNVYFAGRLIKQGTDSISGTQAYATNPDDAFVGIDRLGSVRKTQAGVTSYLPYGEELSGTGNGAIKFGTYTRDGSTGLDYADQRYYSSGFGRFMSADPSDPGDVRDPGGWNLYAYTGGDPVNFYDPLGLNCANTDFIYNGVDEGTIGGIIAQNSNVAILATAEYTESGHGPGSNSIAEETAIAEVIMNRWAIVNGYWWLNNGVAGSTGTGPLSVSPGWGVPDGQLFSIIQNPSQFAIYQQTANGGFTLTFSAQRNLNSALSSDSSSSACNDLAWAIGVAYSDWNNRNFGAVYLVNGLALTSFNSFSPAHSSAPYEQRAASYGDANVFYGVPLSYLTPQDSPFPYQPKRLRGRLPRPQPNPPHKRIP